MHRIVHICYMPHSYVRYLIHMCEMSHATHCNTLQEMWHAAFIREMPHSYTHMHEALHTYEWGIAHIWKRHCTHTNSRKGSDNVSHDVLLALKEAYHTFEWGIAHIRIVERAANEASHIWMRHVTYMYEDSYVRYLIHMWNISFICEIFHSYVKYFIHMWNISFICVIGLF